MTTKKGIRDLQRALKSSKPVVVYRGINGAGGLKSHVVGVGGKWALPHTVSDQIAPNGHSAVRVGHATSSNRPGVRFTHRALIAALDGRRLPVLAGPAVIRGRKRTDGIREQDSDPTISKKSSQPFINAPLPPYLANHSSTLWHYKNVNNIVRSGAL